MKVSGLLYILAIVVVVNSLVANPADVVADLEGSWNVISSGCKGPFGFDSQKASNDKGSIKYGIGIIRNIDLEKSNDGSWYVDNCEVLGPIGTIYLRFTSPYPQRYDLKVGDIIGFKAKLVTKERKEYEGLVYYHYYYSSGEVLDHISSQSAKCEIRNIRGLSSPSKTIPTFPTKHDYARVTGVIMAVETIENEDPEPDNPSDYLILGAVMKCADGVLYIVDFEGHNYLAKDSLRTDSLQQALGYPKSPHKHVDLPSQDAFGEGDVVTVTQTHNYKSDGPGQFFGYYESKLIRK